MAGFLTGVLLFCAVLLTLAWLVAAQRRFVARVARRFLALPRLQQVALVLAVCISTVCAQKTVTNENAIVEFSNNRIIESAEASASDSNDSRRAAENAEGEMAAPQAEEESLSNRNSIIRTFGYSIISPSTFWHLLTPSNSLILTWLNVLLHRLPENPVSFQVEFFANGDFTYRYDFSQLPSDAVLTNAYVIAAPGVGEPFVLGEYSLTRRFRSLGGAEEILEERVS